MSLMVIRKKEGVVKEATQLGSGSDMEAKMLEKGMIAKNADGTYTIYSNETLGGKGQTASTGDYVQMDQKGLPYPTQKEVFERNHVHLKGNRYRQIPQPYYAMTVEQLLSPENKAIREILEEKYDLVLDMENGWMEANLWGTRERISIVGTEDRDGRIRKPWIVLYECSLDESGRPIDSVNEKGETAHGVTMNFVDGYAQDVYTIEEEVTEIPRTGHIPG